MKTLNYTRIPALLALLAVAACDDAGTDLAFEDLTPEEELELAVLADPGSFDIAVELTDVSKTHPETTRRLRAQLLARLEEQRERAEQLGGGARPQTRATDPSILEQLRALGYLVEP